MDNRAHVVAVVDDDPAVLDSLKFLLEVAGHSVATYDSAASFLADDGGTTPSCLILDHHMPQMSGLDLAARLRAAGADIPVLLITGSPSPAIYSRAAQLGIERVLEKPLDENALLSFANAHH